MPILHYDIKPCEDIWMESMRPMDWARRPAFGRHHRAGMPAAAAKVLGTSCDAIVPLQRHPPRMVLAFSLAELVALGALITTGAVAAMVALLVCSAGLVAVAFTNTRRVLVITTKGNVILSASTSGWPNGVVGPADRSLELPAPTGIGVAMTVGTSTWWIDRSSYRWLNRARSLLDPKDAG
jgi:hypothetical protein